MMIDGEKVIDCSLLSPEAQYRLQGIRRFSPTHISYIRRKKSCDTNHGLFYVTLSTYRIVFLSCRFNTPHYRAPI